jgi:hypothetical protein
MVEEGACEVECLVISSPEMVLELYERNILQKLLRDDYVQAKILLENRYPHLLGVKK